MSTSRTPYRGTHRDLVVAIDFGTTCSGVSYSILEPGAIPQIRSVSGFEGQDDGSTKVPSLLYYDLQGNLRAAGAQINNPELALQAQAERWIEVAWLKLLFCPDNHIIRDIEVPQVVTPKSKNPVQVLGDFLQYLVTATKDYITHSEVDGAAIWASVEERIIYILSYPNGWKDSQCSLLLEASLHGKLFPNADSARERLQFISEGEASFHWCLENVETPENFSVGSDIIVADLGGGSIDVSSFRITSKSPLQLEEMRPPQGRLAGSVVVNRAFRGYVEEKLPSPDYGYQTINYLNNEFDRNTKKSFRHPARKHFVPLGTPAHDPLLGIHSGQLQVPGSHIAEMFEPSCRAITEAIESQYLPDSLRTTVFLVGGFAASPWVFDELRRRLLHERLEVKRAHRNETAKAVAEGAVGYYLEILASAGTAKFTYGTFATRYDPANSQHIRRKHQSYMDGGKKYIFGGFTPLWKKGAVLGDNPEIRQKFDYCPPMFSRLPSYTITFELIRYQGSKVDVGWQDEGRSNFRPVCTVQAVIPASSFKWKVTKYGIPYKTLTCWRVFTFAGTMPSCHLEWEENGQRIRTPSAAALTD